MRIPLALVVMLFGVIACSSSPTDSLSDAPADIQAFLAGDSAVGIRAGTPIVLPGTDVLMYRISYGPPLDCPSGCFYAQAYLAKVGSRVGWLAGASPVPMRRRFPVQAQDSTVFTATVFSQLKDRDANARFALALAIVCAAETPESFRRRLVADVPHVNNPQFCTH